MLTIFVFSMFLLTIFHIWKIYKFWNTINVRKLFSIISLIGKWFLEIVKFLELETHLLFRDGPLNIWGGGGGRGWAYTKKRFAHRKNPGKILSCTTNLRKKIEQVERAVELNFNKRNTSGFKTLKWSFQTIWRL